MSTCILQFMKPYKNMFGKMGQGIHNYRVMNTAIVDYILTLVGAVVITYYFKIPLVLTTILLFILGVFVHFIFGVNTNTIKYLGLNCN